MVFAILSAAAFIALTARFLHGLGLPVFDVVFFTAPWSIASSSAIALARKRNKSSIAYGGIGGFCGAIASYGFDMVLCGSAFPWTANQCVFIFSGFTCCGMITAGIVSCLADGLTIKRRDLQGLAEQSDPRETSAQSVVNSTSTPRSPRSGSLSACCAMNLPLVNPYAPPNADASASAANSRNRELLPLWIWLGVAVAISFLGTPADPISILLALAYGLVSFWVGAILGSSLNVIIRVILGILWIIPAIALALMGVASYLIVLGLCYFVLSIVMGVWVWRRINNGRLRIVLCFSAGYVLGSVVGPLGTLAGAVLGTILAKRSLPKPGGG